MYLVMRVVYICDYVIHLIEKQYCTAKNLVVLFKVARDVADPFFLYVFEMGPDELDHNF